MSTDYELGTVAIVKVSQSDCGRRAFRLDNNGWTMSAKGYVWDNDATDVRPLVVLDIDACTNPADALRLIANEDTVNAKRSLLLNIADQIEAQTKPPRIPEPGLWGVVEAGFENNKVRTNWVHHHSGWFRGADDCGRSWSDLIEPTLIREGVES